MILTCFLIVYLIIAVITASFTAFLFFVDQDIQTSHGLFGKIVVCTIYGLLWFIAIPGMIWAIFKK